LGWKSLVSAVSQKGELEVRRLRINTLMNATIDTPTRELREYRRDKVILFRKTAERFGGLSNMAPGFPLRIHGTLVLTSEALYQACRFPHLPEVQRLIVAQRSPMTAKMKSKPYRQQSRPDWDAVRVKVMRWCLRVKLAQHPDKFGELLRSTLGKPIVEESLKDDFWGAKPTTDGPLIGRNVLGRLLMELRQWTEEHPRSEWSQVDPPAINDLRFLGREIGRIEGEQKPKDFVYSMIDETFSAGQQAAKDSGSGMNEELDSHPAPDQVPLDKGHQMIPKECKRLAEVDFPIAAVSKHAAREKSIRHGHPSTLHLWWARRPLASSRAVLLALLLPDPCDEHCPPNFKAKAKKLLPQVGCGKGETDAKLREGLLKFIGDFANWDFATNATFLEVARGLVKAAHPEETPLVVDPFAGGGSIPLEALRLGCDAFASDLNPVACLILKVMLEDIPRHGPGLSDELRKAGAEIKRQTEQELAEFYPPDADGAHPITYLWARTVRCEAPDCGAEIPLVRSFWLCKKLGRRRALRYTVMRSPAEAPHVEFEIFEPSADSELPIRTVHLGNAACPACHAVLTKARVRAQLQARSFGSDSARLLAVVTLDSVGRGRNYRLPTSDDFRAVRAAQARLERYIDERSGNDDGVVPTEPLPVRNTRNSGFGPRLYGATIWGHLFSARQKLGLVVLSEKVQSLSANGSIYSQATIELLALVVSKLTELACACCAWEPLAECPRHVFGRQAIPVNWDFAEGVLTSDSSGSFSVILDNVASTLASIGYNWLYASPQLADASESPLPDQAASVWFTDPPYYDSVAYADLSDFFFVWLKRILPHHPLMRDPFDAANPLTPKAQECIQNEEFLVDGSTKDRAFFERKLTEAFLEGRRVSKSDAIGCVVFAHKTTEGWEALLAGLLNAGWMITASWPITTEMASRLVARNTAALAASVHLVCRPRSGEVTGDWAEVLRELPKRVAEWMQRLQSEHVRGADLVFACIGPALEIFSRYARVETAEGREVPLAEYLEKVWEVVGRAALEQVLGGSTGALEEDARLTALFLWTLQSSNGIAAEAGDEEDEEAVGDEDEAPRKKKTGGYTLVFDVARRFAQPLGIHLPEWEGRIIEIEKGAVRLLPVAERAKQLFGEDGASTAAAAFERNAAAAPQMVLFPEDQGVVPKVKGRGRKKADGDSKAGTTASAPARREATTLDRVHAAMLLQGGGQANALRALLQAEQDRGSDFLRLANALSALYPRESEEKRLLDAMLLAVPR
jgi:ribA/ribD-fused uncharacterized protein